MNETELQFYWWENETKLSHMELDCTIPLNVGDAMIHKHEGIEYHLQVERRLYVPEANKLAITFKQTTK